MTRIFFTLALLSVLLLCVNIVLGLRIGDYNGQFAAQRDVSQQIEELDQDIKELKQQRPRPRDEIAKLDEKRQQTLAASEAKLAPMRLRFFVHMMFGIVAALTALLVNSICMTYFVGTSRWIREVVETYGFPRALIDEGNAIKRRTFPWALGGMLTVVGIIALGQAANPGIIRAGTAAWVTPHLVGALLGTALITLAYARQSRSIAENYALIGRIVQRVQQVRREKGLEVDDGDDVKAERALKPEFSDTVTR